MADETEYVCDHSLDAPDDVFWKWVTGDGHCMLCGRIIWAGGERDLPRQEVKYGLSNGTREGP
jgi:hypothetical protein